MKCLERNKTSFHYALFLRKEPITDDYGNDSGEYRVIYDTPVEMRACVSAASGEAQIEQFGNAIMYDRVIISDEVNCPIDENSILWVESTPANTINLGNLPTGAKVKFGSYQVNTETAQPVIWTVVAKNHSGYPSNAITLHTAGIIDLRCFDAKESRNPNANRQNYGNSLYSVANIDHWLNSNAAANAWYAAQHACDQSPDTSDRCGGFGTQYAARPGFLNLFTTAEQNAIMTTTLRVVKPPLDGGSYEDIARKVFFPSTTEVGLANENDIAEGSTWGYYTSNAARIAYATQQCVTNSPSSSQPSSTTAAWYWWLRTPYYSHAISARIVPTDASLSYLSAYNGNIGVRPALNLSSSLLVSGSTDTDGCYTFVWNATSHDYIVKKVARSLNTVSFAISKVKVS